MRYSIILFILVFPFVAFSQTLIQAEDGLLSKANIQTTYSGYTGSGYVYLFSKTGAYVDVVFRRSTAATDSVRVRFANGSGSTRSLAVTLNGTSVGTLSFPKTANWTTWSTVSIAVPMQAGTNHLQFTTTGTSTYPILDNISIDGQASVLQYKVTLTKSGNGSVSADPSATYYDSGATVQLSATASGSSFFNKWFSESFSTTLNPYSTPVTKHMTLVGVFLDTTGLSNFPYRPNPTGFASVNALGNNGTTGGAGGEVAIVTSTAELWDLMLARTDANHNLNFPPLTVYVAGILAANANTNGNTYLLDIKDAYNISLIGIGNDATITGYGIAVTRSINVIIRNIKFASCPNDGVSLQADDDPSLGHHIWVDHCTFTPVAPAGYPQASSFDGSLDITHTVSYMTASWNRYIGTDKNSLIGHSDNNTSDVAMKISYDHCYFDSSVQRNPRVRFASVHVYNNYYRKNSIYGVSSNMEADVLVEGSYFSDVAIPVETSRDGSPPGDLVERNNIFVNCGVPGTRGTAFDPTLYYSYTLDSANTIPAMVGAYSGSGKYDFSNTTTSFTLAVSATNGAVTKDPDQESYEFGETVLLTATPNDGYHFVSWTGNVPSGHEGDNPLTITMDGNKSLTATFASQTFTLTTLATNGSITKNPSQASYDSGATVQLTAVPATGYHFVNWSGDTSGSTNPVTITMNSNKSVTANFAINWYTLNVTATNGTVVKNPDSTDYVYGSSVVLTATPDSNYQFLSWSGDASGNTNPLTVVMDANKNITANFGYNGIVGIQSNGTGGGDWNNTATWLNGVVPTSNDTVAIVGTDSVIITSAAACKMITVKTGGKLFASAVLTVTNTFTLQSGAYYYYSASSTLTLPGTPVLDNASTVIYNYSGSSSTLGAGTYGNLTLVRNGNTTPNGTVTINGDLTLNNGSGSNVFRGTSDTTSRVNTVHGNVYINYGTLACIDAGKGTATGTWNIDGDVFITGTSNSRLGPFSSGAEATVVGTINIGGNLTISGGRLQYATNSSTTGIGIVNVSGNVTIDTLSSITDNGSNGPFSLNFVGVGNQTVTLGMNFAMATTTTLNDTIKAGSNVIFNLRGHTWRIPSSGSFVVHGSLALLDSSRIIGPGGFILSADARLKLGSPYGIAATDTVGNVQTLGSRSFSTDALYEYNGSREQVTGTGLPSAIAELTINNPAGVVLSKTTTVATSLKLQSGILTTNADTLEVASAGNTNRTDGFINGNLRKTIQAGESLRLFEIGDGANYTPIELYGSSYTDAWKVTASTVPSDHPDILNSGLLPEKTVNRYYVLSGNSTGPSNISFTFVPADLDADVDTNQLVIKKYNNPVWTSTTVGARTSLSVQALGVTSLSEFAIGQTLESVQYSLSVTLDGNGTVSKNPDQPVYDPGTPVILTAIPESGWRFEGWSGDLSGMKNPDTLTMNSDIHATATFVLDSTTVGIPVSSGWNLLSLPVDVFDPQQSAVFPTSSSAVFYYYDRYVRADTVWTGLGFWLKFDADETVPVSGIKLTADTIQVYRGWNMIGALTQPLDVSDIVQIPSGIIRSSFFAFANGYSESTTLMPGMGYWVKVSADGQLILSQAASAAKATKH